MIKTYEVYYCDYAGSDDPFHANDLEIVHNKRDGTIKISLDLGRWRNCDHTAEYLEWAADQILRFKDLKGVHHDV